MSLFSPERVTGFLLCVLIVGCGPAVDTGERVSVVPVSGTLSFQGQPLTGYQVTVMPKEGARVATGVSDASGHFVLGTNEAGDGCPAGPCRIAIVWSPPDTTADNPGTEQIVDDPRKLPKPTVVIPAKFTNPETSGLDRDVPADGSATVDIELRE
ncbi:MAG: hypothetical protein KDA89_11615 [Planctomycetaceae bacterium]|nr:hypothetical protein [Planctomycetaceae bacterium]